MGLFGGRTKTTVGTFTSRVISDEQLPNAVVDGMTRNLVGDGEQLIEQIMESLAGSIATRSNRMYSYGKNRYIYGLPSGSVFSSFQAKQANEAVIEQQVGPVSINYYHFGPLNSLHVGWKKLLEEHGYERSTNKILSLSTDSVPVFLKDMRVIVTEATLLEISNGSLDQWGTPPNAGVTPEKKFMNLVAGEAQGATIYAVDTSAPKDYVLVETCWEELQPIAPGSLVTMPVVKFGSFTISLDGYDLLADWHHAKYVTQDGAEGYWLYQANAGTYPDIDNIFDSAHSDTGTFFPWVYFRYAKTSMGADKQSEGYLSSKGLVDTLNMNYDQLIDAIHDNPDIAEVEQAMMVMAVPANTTNPIEQRYLFDFFSGLYENVKNEPNSGTNTNDHTIRGLLDNALNLSSIVMQDKRFKMSLRWRNIVKRKVAGVIGLPGEYKGGANLIPSTASIPTLDGDVMSQDTSTKRHYYQHQITKDVFEEVQIFDLQLMYYVFEGYTTIGDEDDEILLIPVDINIAKNYTLAEREQLFSRSLHYVFNSRVVTKLKWYQTGVFRIVMVIIAIVITVLSEGTTWQTIGAALAAGTITLTAIIIALIQELVQYLVVQYLIKLFVKEFGVKLAFLVAILAAIAGSYQAIEAGSVAGAPYAAQLLSLSTGLTKAINVQFQEDFKDLLGEQEDFQQFVKDQTKLLDDTNNLLTHNERLAPLVIFGEKPQDYYQRTVHSGNIGVLGLDAISSYVDVALTLPKLSDTIS
jgi:hypothetical protein